MSYVSVNSALEVHVQRLHNAFAKAGIAGKLRFALRVLVLMREVEHLGYGYWFPTPTRAVRAENLTFVVSASPTSELKRHFPSVQRAGYARLVSAGEADELVLQALDQWLGDPPRSTTVWAQSELARARSALGPTLPSDSVEFFSVSASGSGSSSARSPGWTHDPSRAIVEIDGLVLCRERYSLSSSRRFVGMLVGKKLGAESNSPVDADRLQFGMAALAGRNISVRTKALADADVYFIPAQLPLAERRLLYSLGRRDCSLQGRAYRVDRGTTSSLLNARLRALGADVRSSI